MTSAGFHVDADLARAAHGQLVEALAASWALCGPPREVSPGVFAGPNLAELLAAALTELAGQVGGVEVLVWHRPGCWEADEVRRLAAPLIVVDADDVDRHEIAIFRAPS